MKNGPLGHKRKDPWRQCKGGETLENEASVEWRESTQQQREIPSVCIRASRAFEHSCTCRMAFALHYFWPIILTAMFPLQYLSSYTNIHP